MSTNEHDLVASAAAARGVVESFRQWQIVVPDWEGTLQDVVEVLGSLPSGGAFQGGLTICAETWLSCCKQVYQATPVGLMTCLPCCGKSLPR